MYFGGVESGVCGFYTTLHTEYCYSCRRWQRLYSVYSGLSPLPGGKAVSAFRLGGLAVQNWSVQGGSFVKFLGLVNYRVIAGKMHSQSPILKTKGHSATR